MQYPAFFEQYPDFIANLLNNSVAPIENNTSKHKTGSNDDLMQITQNIFNQEPPIKSANLKKRTHSEIPPKSEIEQRIEDKIDSLRTSREEIDIINSMLGTLDLDKKTGPDQSKNLPLEPQTNKKSKTKELYSNLNEQVFKLYFDGRQ